MKGIAISKLLDCCALDARSPPYVFHALERGQLPRADDLCAVRVGQPADLPQAEPYGEVTPAARLQRTVPAACVDARWPNHDAVLAHHGQSARARKTPSAARSLTRHRTRPGDDALSTTMRRRSWRMWPRGSRGSRRIRSLRADGRCVRQTHAGSARAFIQGRQRCSIFCNVAGPQGPSFRHSRPIFVFPTSAIGSSRSYSRIPYAGRSA